MPSDRLNYFFILFFSLLFQSVQEFWMMIHLRRLSLLKCGELLNLSCSTMICPRQNWLAVSYTLYFFVQYTSNPASLLVAIIVCQDMQLAFFKLFVCCCVRVSLDNYSGYFFVDICSNQGWNSLFCLLLQHVAPAHRCAWFKRLLLELHRQIWSPRGCFCQDPHHRCCIPEGLEPETSSSPQMEEAFY